MLPKSLHTVSTLVALARHLAEINSLPPDRRSVIAAVRLLGYEPAGDVHGLIDVACRKLEKLAR